MTPITQIESKKSVFSTPWFDLVAKRVASSGNAEEPYYSIQTLDYVVVLPMTADHQIILVKQYRPAIEAMVAELPSGHVEKGELPEDAARRELLEETGCRTPNLQRLGSFWSDTGRMSNRVWYFFAWDIQWKDRAAAEDAGIEPLLIHFDDFIQELRNGHFTHSLNLAPVLLAFLNSESFRERLLSSLEAK